MPLDRFRTKQLHLACIRQAIISYLLHKATQIQQIGQLSFRKACKFWVSDWIKPDDFAIFTLRFHNPKHSDMKYSISNSLLAATIDEKGAELTNLLVSSTQQELIWQASAEYWARHSPVLFPVVGKLRNDTYTFRGAEYRLPQHGFARDMPFTLLERKEDRLVFELLADANTMECYPYIFSLQVAYQLFGNRIEISYRVENRDDKDIFFSIGAHPAFNYTPSPLSANGTWMLRFEKTENVSRHLLSGGLFNLATEPVLEGENTLHLTADLLSQDAIVFKDLSSDRVTLCHPDGTPHLSVSFPGFPYLGIWSKSPEAPFLCIEPWYGLADSADRFSEFSEKEGIQSLPRGGVFTAAFSIIAENA